MAKPTDLITLYEEETAKGCGAGRYDKYRPWLTVWNSSSRANRSHLWSPRQRRQIHFLSHGEYLAYLQFDWDRNVVDIREQFPLDPKETIQICSDLKVLHPGYQTGGHVMTSDFVVTYRTPEGLREHAYQVKRSQAELENKRTYTKLMIEREYWKRKQISWDLLFSSKFNQIRTYNLERLIALRFTDFSEEELCRLMEAFIGWHSMYPDCVVRTLPHSLVPLGRKGNISAAIAVLILAAHQRIKFSIDETRIDDCPIGDFVLAGELKHADQ